MYLKLIGELMNPVLGQTEELLHYLLYFRLHRNDQLVAFLDRIVPPTP